MSAGALLKDQTDKRFPWVSAVERAAGPGYRMLGQRQLVGLLLVVVARRDLAVSEVSLQQVKCGAGAGMGGNKGGIGLRLRLRNTTIAFINSHLAAHMKEVAKRNEDFARIVDTMVWEKGDQVEKGEKWAVREHDCVFFFGDLNYRIEGGQQEVMAMIERKEWERLLRSDQLRTVYASPRNPYRGFRDALVEAPPFAPTYKYTAGSPHYDAKEGGKKRVPAWCDRVLWRAQPEGGPPCAGRTKLASFTRCDELMSSDHRPVSAVFIVEVHPAAQHSPRAAPARAPPSLAALGGAARRMGDASGAYHPDELLSSSVFLTNHPTAAQPAVA